MGPLWSNSDTETGVVRKHSSWLWAKHAVTVLFINESISINSHGHFVSIATQDGNSMIVQGIMGTVFSLSLHYQYKISQWSHSETVIGICLSIVRVTAIEFDGIHSRIILWSKYMFVVGLVGEYKQMKTIYAYNEGTLIDKIHAMSDGSFNFPSRNLGRNTFHEGSSNLRCFLMKCRSFFAKPSGTTCMTSL